VARSPKGIYNVAKGAGNPATLGTIVPIQVLGRVHRPTDTDRRRRDRNESATHRGELVGVNVVYHGHCAAEKPRRGCANYFGSAEGFIGTSGCEVGATGAVAGAGATGSVAGGKGAAGAVVGGASAGGVGSAAEGDSAGG